MVFPLKLLYRCHTTHCLSVRDNILLQNREKIAMLSQAILPVKRLCHAAPDGQANILVPWQGTETAKVVSVCPPKSLSGHCFNGESMVHSAKTLGEATSLEMSWSRLDIT